jgi:basic membrane protein A
LHEFEQSQCDLIVSVGFPLGDATFNAASANAKQNFQVLDFAVNSPPPNLRADLYSVDQAAFLAGYLAASATKTGKVGTFGGMQLPPVVEFMDGFALGVQYYNTVHGSGVRVLGWDPGRQSGTFGDNFTNTSDGRRLAEGLMNAGADIILPVAGHMGLGAAEIVKERGNAWVIGVDDDWRVSAPAYADVVLTSVIKRLDVSVFQAVEAAAAGRFKGGTYLGTRENGGVDITLDSPAIPDAMRSELEAVRTAIITGKLKTKP